MVFLGIDGGGTKTEYVLAAKDGEILTHGFAGPTNPNDLPAEQVRESLAEIASAVREYIPCRERLAAVYAGVAGALNHRDVLLPALTGLFPEADVEVGSDAQNLLTCGLLGSDGCGLIAGTGSVCFVKKGDRLTRIGGWGYLIDTAGSGYDIGRDVLTAALEAFDGRGPETVLSDLIRRKTGRSAEELVSDIYDGGKKYIASFAPLAFEGFDSDEVSERIVKKNAEGLARLVEAAAKHFDGQLEAVCGGGIFTNHPVMIKILKTLVPERVHLSVIPAPPVFGALAEARKLAGIETDERDRAAFVRALARALALG